MKQIPVLVLSFFAAINIAAADSTLSHNSAADVTPLILAKGPPDHAKAHGYRNKNKVKAKHAYKYQYYPDAEIYFDPGRNVYFYLNAGNWVTAATLPRRLNVRLGSSVSLDMDIPTPYELHKEHRLRFPSGVKVKLR